jgi:hypothetical protein
MTFDAGSAFASMSRTIASDEKPLGPCCVEEEPRARRAASTTRPEASPGPGTKHARGRRWRQPRSLRLLGLRSPTWRTSTSVPAVRISLSGAGLTERSHPQEWVIAHPEMLGPGVMVVALDFDRWRSAAGTPERDRLECLVSIDTVEMQALKYAAMVSRFTAETLADQHAQYLARRGQPTDQRPFRDLLEAHIRVRTCAGESGEAPDRPACVYVPRIVTATTRCRLTSA